MHFVEKRPWSNAKTSYYNGDYYDSNFEAGYAAELDKRKKAQKGSPERIEDWERQVRIECFANGKLITTYKVDFKLHRHDGSVELVECKGREDEYARLRWKLLEAQINHDHPHWKLTLVRQQTIWTKKLLKSKGLIK